MRRQHRWHSSRIFLAYAAWIAGAASAALAAFPTPTSINWNPKRLPLPEIQRRARFDLLLPKKLPAGYALITAQIVWVTGDPGLPDRQAVRLTYRMDHPSGQFDIVEVKHLPRVSTWDNTMRVIGEGYVGSFVMVRGRTAFHPNTKGGVDYCIVSHTLSHEQFGAVAQALTPAKKSPTPPTKKPRRALSKTPAEKPQAHRRQSQGRPAAARRNPFRRARSPR